MQELCAIRIYFRYLSVYKLYTYDTVLFLFILFRLQRKKNRFALPPKKSIMLTARTSHVVACYCSAFYFCVTWILFGFALLFRRMVASMVFSSRRDRMNETRAKENAAYIVKINKFERRIKKRNNFVMCHRRGHTHAPIIENSF